MLPKRFYLQELSSQNVLDTLISDVQSGMLIPPRKLPPKYFYDEKGSMLFDKICNTKDYYPTRSERELLEKNKHEIIQLANPQTVIELGAGTSDKTEVLFSCMQHDLTYIAIDVCKEVLLQSADRILNKYNNISIRSIAAEYVPAIHSLEELAVPKLFIFIGSSIGNFTEPEAINLLKNIAEKMHKEDFLLIGVDRVKDKAVLEKAYDDDQGITAEFNLNVLNVLNKELGANFDLKQFAHQAIYNEKDEQIEMYLVSSQRQQVYFSVLNQTIELNKNEKILTEISRKYTKKSISSLLEKSGLAENAHFEPSNEYFSLVLAQRDT